jgi:putative oxidoreductase
MSAIFLISGLSKPPPRPTPSATSSPPELPFAKIGLAIAVFVEIVGGLALLVGYRTRVAAAVLAAFTVATALAFHNDLADQNQFFHFFKNIAMAGGLLQVVAFGAPRLSLDPRRH